MWEKKLYKRLNVSKKTVADDKIQKESSIKAFSAF